MNVLVLEASTSAAKAMVYNENTGILHTEVIQYTEIAGTDALQDVLSIVDSLIKAGRAACAKHRIEAIAIVSTWHSLLLCKNSQPVSPIYNWMFTESDAAVKSAIKEGLIPESYHRTTGCMPHAMYPYFKLLYLKSAGINVADCEICGLGEFIFLQLTGKRAMSINMASGSGLLNIRTLEWDRDLLDTIGIKKSNLPDLYDKLTLPVQKSVSDELGVTADVPVSLAYADGFMNQVGAGAYQKGIMTMSIGTSCAVRVMSDTPIAGETQSFGLWNYYGIDSHMVGAATAGGTNCVNWFLHQISGAATLKELDQNVLSGDLPVFLPFLYGERCPGWDAIRTGGFVELKGSHGLPEMYSALLEGILFNIFQCYKQLSALYKIEKINLSGGILYSPVWRQMAADLFQSVLYTPSSEQASLLGGAAIALSSIDSSKKLSDFTCSESEPIRPQADKSAYYEERYQKYLDAYQRLRKED